MPYKDPEKQKEFLAQHYKTNKGQYAASSRLARKRRKAKLHELKDAPCVDCGKKFHPVCMEYDHIGTDKIANISRLLLDASWQAVLDEIEKCELVCANCHRVRSWLRALGKPLDTDPFTVI